jgi:hypothetical protein
MKKSNTKRGNRLTPEQLDANYERLMKAKEFNPNGKEKFDKAIKKASKPHSSK